MQTNKKVEVVEYDENWPKIFETEKSNILSALQDNCIEIHHVGSTSVKGLIAKPKIDIITVAKDRKQAISSLEQIGYVHDGEWNIPLKCGFAKRTGTHVNLHMFFDKNHPEIELNLGFRNFLRQKANVRNEYANLKRKIFSNPDNATDRIQVGTIQFPRYTLLKRNFIDNVLRQIGFNRLRVLKCLTDDEQYAARKFSQMHGKGMHDNISSSIDFSDANYEHFMLYKGVNITGYAKIQIAPTASIALIEVEDPRDEEFFKNIITQWIEIHFPENENR